MIGDENEEVKKYIGNIAEKIEKNEIYCSTGNVALDSVINYKLRKASEQNIQIYSNITIPSNIREGVEDLVTIIGNLLDNAIEACENLTEGKYLEIKMKYKQGTMFIEVKNRYDGIVKMRSGKIATKKEDKTLHGIGLKSVESAVNNHNGTMKVDFNEKEKIIAYVGRLSRWDKNPIRLLKVWRKLYKRFPDWRLQIIGSGLEHDNMLQYVEKYHLPRVCFEGQQSDVSGYYKKISVICLTSNTEGFSMSLIEGMSFGCVPVAFSNYAAVWDIIDDDINGCLVKPFDIKLYATRLAEIMSNEGKRIDMARQALEKSKIFDIENIVDKWEALFKSVYNA